MIDNKTDRYYYAAIAMIVFLMLMVYSYSTSFLYDKPALGDAAIFMTIGKAWADGCIPYIDLWDSKGPIIFFVNYLGYSMLGSKIGVFTIQYICLLISAFSMYKLLRIGYNQYVSLIILVFVLISFCSLGMGGNTVAEYVLPLLAIAYYRVYKWTETVENKSIKKHKWIDALLYGAIVSFCLFSRLTNCVGISFIVVFVTIWLVKNRAWKNLMQNIVSFFLGVMIVALPICMYFISNDSFGDMWFATFLYNIDYAKTSSGDLLSVTGLLKSMIVFSETWIMAVISLMVICFSNRRKLFGVLWLLISVFTIIYLIKSNGYAHYGIISLPLICISVLELKALCSASAIKHLRLMKNAVIATYMFIALGYNIHTMRVFTMNYLENKELKKYEAFLSDVPYGYKSSFVAYNPSPHIYLYMDIMPKYKFFVFQDFGANINEKYNQMLRQCYSKCESEWILVENSDYAIKDVLHKSYDIYKKDQELTLYRKK